MLKVQWFAANVALHLLTTPFRMEAVEVIAMSDLGLMELAAN